MVKVAVTSPSFSSNSILRSELEEYFPNVKYNLTKKNLEYQKVAEFIADSDALILGLEKVDATIFNQCKKLIVISKYGVGLNNIVLSDAIKANIAIKFEPGINKRSVAELVIAQMISINRNIFNSMRSVKSGEWIKDGGFEISGKRVGIIGFGNVGMELARLLKPFGVDIYANDILDFACETSEYNVKRSGIEKILTLCEIISLHVPYSEKTHHLIGATQFNLMKEGSIIINTSRGGIVDEVALLSAVKDKKIRAALDVFEVEPQLGTALINHPNVYPTPHIGGNSNESVLAMGRAAIKNLQEYFQVAK